MFLLVKFGVFLLLSACTLCGADVFFAGEEFPGSSCAQEVQQTKFAFRTPGETLFESVQKSLQYFGETGVYLETLKNCCGPTCREQKRDLYRVIIRMRADGHEILHDSQRNRFTWTGRVRQTVRGCYKEKLWVMLDDSALLDQRDIVLAMDLSSMGYNPTFAGVEAIQTLKRILSGCQLESKVFFRRKAVWNKVSHRRFVPDLAICRSFLEPGITWTVNDSSSLNQCLEFYHTSLCPALGYSLDEREKIKRYIKAHPDGVLLEEFGVFMQQELQKPPDVWSCIRETLYKDSQRFGYKCGRIFLLPHEGVWQSKGEILSDICLIAQECLSHSETIKPDEVLFALYQRRHSPITLTEVQTLLDILVVTGRLSPCPVEYETFEREWKALCSAPSQAAYMTERFQRLWLWNNQHILNQVRKKRPVDILRIVRTYDTLGANDCLPCAKRLCLQEDRAEEQSPSPRAACAVTGHPCEGQETAGGEDGGTKLSQFVGKNEEIMRRQSQVLHHLERVSGAYVLAQELHDMFYEKEETEEGLLEDVLCLICSGKNIQYGPEGYRLLLEERPQPQPGRDSFSTFKTLIKTTDFKKKSVVGRTSVLHAMGFWTVPVSTVALYSVLFVEGVFAEFPPQKLQTLVALKDQILQEQDILAVTHYKQDVAFYQIRKKDVELVRKSLRLYAAGLNLLRIARAKAHHTDEQALRVYRYLNDERRYVPCSAASLRSVLAVKGKTGNWHRDLSRAIVLLRSKDGCNITHDCTDCAEETFTLQDGPREVKQGSWQRALWETLLERDPDNLLSLAGHRIFLELSDRGWNPVWAETQTILELNRLFFCDARRGTMNFERRKKIWDIALHDGVLKTQSYYEKMPALRGGKSLKNDMITLGQCWLSYINLLSIYGNIQALKQGKLQSEDPEEPCAQLSLGNDVAAQDTLLPVDEGTMPPLSLENGGAAHNMLLPVDEGTMPPLSLGNDVAAHNMLLPVGEGAMPPLSLGNDVAAHNMLLPVGEGAMPPLSLGNDVAAHNMLLPGSESTVPPSFAPQSMMPQFYGWPMDGAAPYVPQQDARLYRVPAPLPAWESFGPGNWPPCTFPQYSFTPNHYPQ